MLFRNAVVAARLLTALLFAKPSGIFNSMMDFTIAFVVLPKQAYRAISSYRPDEAEPFFKQ